MTRTRNKPRKLEKKEKDLHFKGKEKKEEPKLACRVPLLGLATLCSGEYSSSHLKSSSLFTSP
jgi:hypothetical protein